MRYTRKNLMGFLFIIFLFALYCTLPSIGAVSMGKLLVEFLMYFAICSVVVILICKASSRLLPRMHCRKIEAFIYEKWSDKTFLLVVWGILIIGWIPAYLAFFPGIFGYDSPNQMQQIVGDIPYSSHHPILHTMILGLFMKCGKAIFGTYNGGVALFCIAQGLAVSGSIAYTFLYSKRLKVPFPIFVISMIWCVWNPVIQVLTFNTTKDILFGVFFLHFVLGCYQWITSESKKGVSHIIYLIVIGVLMCLLRNQGIYVVIVFILASLFINRKDKRFLASLCVIVVISQLFFMTTNQVMGVQKGDAREMLSVPMQQLALVCKLYMDGEPVNLTEEEFQKFTMLVDKEHLADFQLLVSDPIKSYFNTAMLKQDLPGYLSLYIKVGLHNVGYYMTALRCMIYSYWDMSQDAVRSISITNTFPEVTEKWGISQESLFPVYKEYLSEYILHKMDERIPILSWLLQPGICIWLFTGLLGLAMGRKDKALILAMLICVLFFGTLLLGPIALLRYLYPLMILTPWLFTLLMKQLEYGGFDERTE